MTRPFNETESNRQLEGSVLKAYLTARGRGKYSYITMPPGSPFDAVGISNWAGKNYTWPIEVKCRNVNHDAYGTLILSARKVYALIEAPHTIGATHGSVLLVRWNDVIGEIPMSEAELSYMKGPVPGGRRDRGQPGDVEDVMHINISRSELMKGVDVPPWL